MAQRRITTATGTSRTATWFVAIAASALFSLGAKPRQNHSPPPVFEREGWPGEGIPVFATTGRPVTLHAEPSGFSPIVGRLKPNRNEPLPYDASRVVTLKAGRVEAAKEASLIGSSGKTYSFHAGDHFDYLQYAGEGGCFIRIAGTIVQTNTVQCDWVYAPRQSPFKSAEAAQVEWWIRLPATAMRKSGWLKTDQTVLIFLPREF